MPENNRKQLKLDRIHRIILSELQSDGRLSNVELARRASISAPPCLRRVRALEKDGFIHGYHANIDAGLLGLRNNFSPWSASTANLKCSFRHSKPWSPIGPRYANVT